jgi:DNA polymerase delta subunit 3
MLTEWFTVTKEEPVWESFSEDEPVGVKPKANSAVPSMEKLKKGPGKAGQGSIMSFFGKK